MEPGDPRRFLQHLAALGRFGGDDRGDPALANERGRMGPGRGIGEDQGDVLGPHIPAVEAIGAARAPLDPADDLQLLVVVAHICVEHDLGEVARRALGGAGEDDVFHPAAAHRLGRAFAHDPADRLQQVGLAAAVGADHAGQPPFDAQFSRLDEALEP